MTHRILAFIGALAIAAATLLAEGQQQPASAAGCPSSPTGDLSGKHVAILVHGWLGEALTETQTRLQEELGDQWAVVAYDYRATNSLWPSSSDTAWCLSSFARAAQEMTGLPTASVYIVAHSMGGILARFAFSEANPDIASAVAGVVTVDTPHNGSPFGGGGAARFWEYLHGLNLKGDASRCLALHHPGSLPSRCAYPPALLSSIDVAQVEGDVTITQSFFGLGQRRVDILSDGIVWNDSQIGYRTSVDSRPTNDVAQSYAVHCDYSGSDLAAHIASFRPGDAAVQWWTGETSLLLQSGSPLLTGKLEAAAVAAVVANDASCGHTKMITNGQAIGAVAGYLREWAKPAVWIVSGTGVGPLQLGASVPDSAALEALVGSEHGLCSPSNQSSWGIEAAGGDAVVDGILVIGSAAPDAPATTTGITLGSDASELKEVGAVSRPWQEVGWSVHTWRAGGTLMSAWVDPDGAVNGLGVGTDLFFYDYC